MAFICSPSRCFDVACVLHGVGVLIGPGAGREQFGPHTMAGQKQTAAVVQLHDDLTITNAAVARAGGVQEGRGAETGQHGALDICCIEGRPEL